jgi:hypothetical protein
MTTKTLLLATALFIIVTCSSYAGTKLISTTSDSKDSEVADWLYKQPIENSSLKLQTPILVAPGTCRSCSTDPLHMPEKSISI